MGRFGASAHKPGIEGLRHGGLAQTGRRALTRFGSGWRGISKLPSEIAAGLHLKAASVGPKGLDAIIGRVKNSPVHYGSHIADLEAAKAWSERTGFNAVLLSEDLPQDMVRSSIRHERIHSLHGRSPNHPFFREKLSKTPELRDAIHSVYSRPGSPHLREEVNALRKNLPTLTAERAEKTRAALNNPLDPVVNRMSKLYSEAGSSVIDKERLAFSNMYNPQIMREMREGGVTFPSQASRLVKQVMQASQTRNATAAVYQSAGAFAGSRAMSRSL